MKYKCIYTNGGGSTFDNGIWLKKQTPKTITLEKVSEIEGYFGVYAMHDVGEKIKVGKNTANPLTDFDDGTFTVYFNRAGIPYYFEPVDNIIDTTTTIE